MRKYVAENGCKLQLVVSCARNANRMWHAWHDGQEKKQMKKEKLIKNTRASGRGQQTCSRVSGFRFSALLIESFLFPDIATVGHHAL